MRQKKNRDEGGGANWMDTYGDLVTLLLCFFVMLFASSTIDAEKWIAIMESFRGQPNGSVVQPIDVSSPTQGFSEAGEDTGEEMSQEQQELLQQLMQLQEQEKSEAQQSIEAQFNQLYEQLVAYVGAQNLEQTIQLSKDGLMIYITIVDGILFDDAQAVIRDEAAEEMLTEISLMVSRHIESVEEITVEGHTDSNPISTAEFRDNLDLSSERANNVARFVSESGTLDMSYFTSYGRSQYDPIATNDTAEGRQRNRRVNINLMARNVDQLLNGLASEPNARINAGAQGARVTVSTASNAVVTAE